jgi:hypothetical protein
MTPGTQTSYNPCINMNLVAQWDRRGTSINKVRLFSAMQYTFIKSAAGGSATFTLYARDFSTTVYNVSGASLSTGEGNISKSNAITFTQGWGAHVGTTTSWNVDVLRADGSTVNLGTGVAGYNVGGFTNATNVYTPSTTWACPGYASWVQSDTIKLTLNMQTQFVAPSLSIETKSWSLTFVLPNPGWTALNATTWTFWNYFTIHAENTWAGQGVVTHTWGSSSYPVKIAGVNGTVVSSSAQSVYSIGSNGVSEVDYIVYMKNYKGN